MSRYILSPQATVDLESIAEFYGDRSPAYADRLIGKLTKKFEFVGRFPKAGTPVDELSPGLRKTPVEDIISLLPGSADRNGDRPRDPRGERR